MLFLFTQNLWAHPVTFVDGTAIMSVHRPKVTHTQINHTLTRNFAVAASYMRLELDSITIKTPILQTNFLLKRWNEVGSQANLYVMSGVGYNMEPWDSSLDDLENRGLVYGGVQIDYETQRIYTALSGFSLGGKSGIYYGGRYRFGLAPYVAKFKELQVWVIGQVDYMSDMEQQPHFTPMLRFFYRTILWESGVSLSGVYWFQMMAHF